MRQAMRQLWMLYGPQSFVFDVQKLLLRLATPGPAGGAADDVLPALLATLQGRLPMRRDEARFLLKCCAGKLLLKGKAALAELSDNRPLGEMVRLAREQLSAADDVAQHYALVLQHVASSESLEPARPYANFGTVPAVCLFGNHSHRTPLSYEPYRAIIGERLTFVTNPEDADLIVTGFNRDFDENAEALGEVRNKRPTAKFVVLSEEPMWDMNWSGGFVERNRALGTDKGGLPYTFLNHENSRIFAFETVPYFPTTTDDFPTIYRNQVKPFAAMSARELLDLWRRAPVTAAFFAEFREGKTYAQAFPELDVQGLCDYRTAVAKTAAGPGVMRAGKGWGNRQQRRQDLPDWHLDKLATLQRRVRVVSALENTHHRHYVSEKIFDAFALGGIPVYFASPQHRVFELVDSHCMINTFDQSVEEAAQRIMSFEPDQAFAEAWLAAANSVCERFGNSAGVIAERQRVAEECLRELSALL